MTTERKTTAHKRDNKGRVLSNATAKNAPSTRVVSNGGKIGLRFISVASSMLAITAICTALLLGFSVKNHGMVNRQLATTQHENVRLTETITSLREAVDSTPKTTEASPEQSLSLDSEQPTDIAVGQSDLDLPQDIHEEPQ